jgi:DNA invertase Pin-like site-specific DNA recombinase
VGIVPAPSDQPIYGLGYYRISGSKEQKDSMLSIPTQERFVLPAMERTEIIYLDADSDILTGKRTDRRGYQRILARARQLIAEGKRVAIFVLRLDRFGRDMEERTRCWKELIDLGARLYSVTEGGWIEDSFVYNMLAAIAAREVELIGKRVRETNEFIRSNGYPIVTAPAWGYRWRDATPDERAEGCGHKNLEPHPDEAAYVREAFRRRADGASLREMHAWARSLPDDARGAGR